MRVGTVIHRVSECPNKSFIFLPQVKTSKVSSQFKPAIKVVLLPDVLTVSRKTKTQEHKPSADVQSKP